MIYDDLKILAVFDGHGPYGHDVSDFCVKRLPNIFLNKWQETNKIDEALKYAFLATHQELVNKCNEDSEFDCALSGTTGTVCVIDNKAGCVWSACCGDSRAILGQVNNKKFKAIDLTTDHKPNLPKEKKRILAAGGDVKLLEGDVPHRVFVRGRPFPGLAMSRSIGDFIAQMVGVSCEPEIFCHKLTSNDLFIFVSSDGVWEFLETKDVGEMV